MVDLLLDGGVVITQNEEREIIPNGAVAVNNGVIVDVGSASDLTSQYDPDREIDASGRAIVPGFVNPHTHVADILLRSSIPHDRGLYDWLFNIKQPATAAMKPVDHELATALFCTEALQSGVTTVVENDGAVHPTDRESMDRKLDVYVRSGIRACYARGVKDNPSGGEFLDLIGRIQSREPDVLHPEPNAHLLDTGQWVGIMESLLSAHHGRASDRISIWVAPVTVEAMSTDGLRRAVELATDHDVMTTTHVAETAEQTEGVRSPIEHLENVGYLGDRTLLGHCVHISESDVRLLAETDTRVSHNLAANLVLGTGFAPVAKLQSHGVTVGLGTDNPSLSDTVNPLGDTRLLAMAHAGHNCEPGQIPAQATLDMITRIAAQAIGRGDDLGVIESGRLADIITIDLTAPHLRPHRNPISTLVYQACGTEIETVICDGKIICENGRVPGIESIFPDLDERVEAATDRLLEGSGLKSLCS